jgi:hypothetical protein
VWEDRAVPRRELGACLLPELEVPRAVPVGLRVEVLELPMAAAVALQQ